MSLAGTEREIETETKTETDRQTDGEKERQREINFFKERRKGYSAKMKMYVAGKEVGNKFLFFSFL